MERYHRIPIFKSLDIKIIEELSFYLEVKHYDYQYDVFTPGACNGIFMVMSGVVEVYL